MFLQPRTTDFPLLATHGVETSSSDSDMTARADKSPLTKTTYYRFCRQVTLKDNENKEMIRLCLNVTDFVSPGFLPNLHHDKKT